MSKKIKRKQTKSLTHRETAESWFPVRDWASAFCLGVLSPGPKTSRELLTPGSINQWKLPQRPPPVSNTQHYPTLSTQCRIPHKTAGKTIQIQSSADRYPKAYHLTQPCPSRRKKLIFYHQNAGTSPSQHKVYTNLGTNLSHWWQKPKGRRNIWP